MGKSRGFVCRIGVAAEFAAATYCPTIRRRGVVVSPVITWFFGSASTKALNTAVVSIVISIEKSTYQFS